MLDKKTRREYLAQTKQNFGAQLCQLRIEHNFTIDELSQQIGIPSIFLQRLENGEQFLEWGKLVVLSSLYDKKILLKFID